jgi:DNA-directed RNA polymerase subunit RPC12/RpoP
MSVRIKLTCAKCKKPLWASSAQAGKRVKCPACQSIILVPAPRAADVEALAAAALGEQPAPKAAPAASKPIDFPCSYCDEEIHVTVEEAGKQMPCPHCTRIVKVPLPAKAEPKDWRKVDPRAGAILRKDGEQAPEGEWGTAMTSRPVSQQSLVDAEVIPVAVERVPLGQRLQVYLLIGAGIVAFAVVFVALFRVWSRSNQQGILSVVLRYAPDKGESPLGSLAAAQLYRAKAEYYLHQGQALKAREALAKALARLAGADAASPGRDLLLISIGRTIVELGGDKDDVTQGKRIAWQEIANDLRRTVEAVNAPEARVMAVRELGQELAVRGQAPLAETLAQTVKISFPRDRAEMRALVALALLSTGDRDKAAGLEADLLKPFAPRLKDEKLAGPLPGPNLLALIVALSHTDQAQRLTKATFQDASQKEQYPEIRLGYSQGLAHHGDWEQARQTAAAPGAPPLRLEALVAVAGIAMAAGQREEAKKCCEPARDIAIALLPTDAGKTLSPWLLWRLVRAAAWAGLPESDLEPIMDAIHNNELRDAARLEIVRARPIGQGDKELEEAAKLPEPPQVLELLARRYAHSGGARKTIDKWEPPTLRPFGYAGLLLGE